MQGHLMCKECHERFHTVDEIRQHYASRHNHHVDHTADASDFLIGAAAGIALMDIGQIHIDMESFSSIPDTSNALDAGGGDFGGGGATGSFDPPSGGGGDGT